MTPRRPAGIVLSDDEMALIKRTIADFEIGGTVRGLLARSKPVTGGRRLIGSDHEIDDLLAALAVEVRGFIRVTEEDLGRELDEPIPGTTAARLAAIYDKIEHHLS
jgi:hypothetical protein